MIENVNVFGALIPLFVLALVGGYIAYVNNKNESSIGVTLRRVSDIKKKYSNGPF